jgi:uncharacterized protein (DUF927 family)
MIGIRPCKGRVLILYPGKVMGAMGAFEVLHGHGTSNALSLALKEATSRHYGSAGVQWLRHVVSERSKLVTFIHEGIRRFVASVSPVDAAGQVLRVARRFGLVAVAGELATYYGLTGWSEGEAVSAARKCFESWLEGFGGAGTRKPCIGALLPV